MSFRRSLAAIALVSLVAGCATTIAPTYTAEKQNIMRIGDEKPSSKEPTVQSTGSFCVETSEVWHDDGTTPDGQTLWAKDTLRKVVPCK